MGVPWLHSTDGTCEYCRAGMENLCEAATFTGHTVDGGYAEYIVAPEAFVYRIPDGFDDLKAAPLLCAGIIGFRCLRISGMRRRRRARALWIRRGGARGDSGGAALGCEGPGVHPR